MQAARQENYTAIPPTLPSIHFTGKVVGVSDGDTISVMHNGKAERIRLSGIDCPEKGQAFGQRAKQFTSALVFGKEVTVAVQDSDKYGRTIGEVKLLDGRVLTRQELTAKEHIGQRGVSRRRSSTSSLTPARRVKGYSGPSVVSKYSASALST